MSFAEGFAKTFAPFASTLASEIIKADFDAEKQFLTDWKASQKEFDKLRLKDNEMRDTAKTLVGSLPGVPPSAWSNVYRDLKMGRTIENIRNDLVGAGFTDVPTGAGAGFSPTDSSPMPDTFSADAQMVDSGLAAPNTTSKTFSFRKSGAERAADRIRQETGLSDTQIADVRAGRFTPETPGLSVMINPANKGSKLTQSDVAGAYMDAARKGPEALADFKANMLPQMMSALDAAGAGPQSTTDLSRALGNLETARNSGDPQRIKRAEDDVNRILDAERMKKDAGASGQPRQFVVTGQDGSTRFVSGFSRITANGQQVVDSSGQPVQGNVREVTESERKDGDEAIKAVTAETGKYRESMTNVTGALRLTDELVDLARSDPRVLTSVAGGVRNVQGALREVNSLVSVLNDVIKDNKGEAVTLQQFEQAAQARGALRGQSLEQLASGKFGNLSMGPTAENLANARSLLESKLILMTFRAGGLEGQTGNAMSNKDFERLQQMIQSSANPQTFERNITDYVRGRVSSLGDQERQINNTPLVNRFRNQYGYSPVEELVTPLQQFIDQRNDPQLKKAYDTVMGRGGQTGGAPAQSQSQGRAPEVPGYTFRFMSPNGKPVYADKDGNLFEAE